MSTGNMSQNTQNFSENTAEQKKLVYYKLEIGA